MLSLYFVSDVIFYVTTFRASHQTGLDTRSMTRRSIIVGFRREEGRARAEVRALLDYDAARPPECDPAEAGGGCLPTPFGQCPNQRACTSHTFKQELCPVGEV